MAEKKGFFGISFSNLKQAISKTSESLVGSVISLAQGKEEIDDDHTHNSRSRFEY